MQDFIRYPAVLSSFISEYVLNQPQQLCELLECRNCGARFFNLRFDQKEMGVLYSRYKGEQYFKVRHRKEFWYTQKVNDGLGHDESDIKARKEGMESFLKSLMDTGTLKTVLDYGGDRGQFIPDHFGKERYVFEVSNSEMVPGVVKISSPGRTSEQEI